MTTSTGPSDPSTAANLAASSSPGAMPGEPVKRPTPDDALPAVTPPSAGFILQLFFIPLLIVVIVVAVWLMFSWMAHMGGTPEQYVQDLKNPVKSSWHSASSLAEMLRDPANEAIKTDAALAQSLVEVLQQQLADGRMDEYDVNSRIFVCRALGEFYIPDGLPVLLTAATTERDVREVDVRQAALQAIAVLASHVEPAELMAHGELMKTLEDASQERREGPEEHERRGQIRATAAFTLGVIGTDEAREILARMLPDAYANARYNAATGLARYGDPRAIDVLVQMLNPEDPGAVEGEKVEYASFKRALVITNGLTAAEQLVASNPGADRTRLIGAVKKLLAAPLDASIRASVDERAKEVLYRLEQSADAPAP